MHFASYEFMGFLILLCLLYFLLPKKYQWKVLLVASLVFYGFSGVKALAFILATSFSVYGTAIGLDKCIAAQKDRLKANQDLTKEQKTTIKEGFRKKRNALIVVCLFLNLGLLAVVKVVPLVPFQVLGISYYTLRAIGYLVDVNRGVYPAEKNWGKTVLYITFFPLVLQGPLTDYGRLAPRLYEEHAFNYERLSRGLLRVLWGFFKKLVIADRAYVAVAAIVKSPDEYLGGWVLVSMILYTLELYCDFSGGIDIALGVSEMLGIPVQENFDRPFFSKSLKEYWRHWHISMSEWFKNYLFYPISVCTPMKKLLKITRARFGEKAGKRIPVYLASFLVWFVTGVWHGASWNFIVWALIHFLILMISEELEPVYDKFHKHFGFSNTKPYRAFMSLRTTFIVSALMQFDIFRNVPQAFSRWLSLFSSQGWSEIFTDKFGELGLKTEDLLILAFGFICLVLVSAIKGEGQFRDKLYARPYVFRGICFVGLFLTVVLFGKYGVGYDPGDFIYTKF